MTVYPAPDAVSDSPYSVTVGGKAVPIERGASVVPAYYARFQSAGKAVVNVSVKGEGKLRADLKPRKYRERFRVTGSTISFDVSKPGPRVLTIALGKEALPPLLVIVDPSEPPMKLSRAPGIYNVKDYGVTSDGIQTANIQKALDACAAGKDGGTVYFGPGIYHTGTIRIRDNTTVYLAPGALIMGSTDPADYPVDVGRVERGSHGVDCSFSRLIMFDHCTNSKICGWGVIDGQGHIMRNKHGRHVQIMDVTASRNIRIENIVLRNSAEWTLHILACDNVEVDNLKIINDYGVGNTDGIDPDCSENVRIRNYFGYCGDDAVAIKTTGNSDLLRPAKSIRVEDSVVVTRKTSYKVGTETYADITDVLFKNCEAVESSRGAGIWARDSGRLSNITYQDCKFDLKEFRKEGMSGEPIRIDMENRHGVSTVSGVSFVRCGFSAPYGSILQGMPESPVDSVRFEDCTFTIIPRQIKPDKIAAMRVSNASHFKFANVKVIWKTKDMSRWDDFLSLSNAKDISTDGITQSR